MSRCVYVSGFCDIKTAEKLAKEFEHYHNNKRHSYGQPAFIENLSEGHLVNILGECENGPTIAIPLYTNVEPRSHGFDTVVDLMEVLKKIDPEYNHIAEELRVEIQAL